MAENFHASIFKKAVELIRAAQEGVRYAELHRQIEAAATAGNTSRMTEPAWNTSSPPTRS